MLLPVVEEHPDVDLMTIERLTSELKMQARQMNQQEARYVVDAYYQVQHYRITAGNQVKAGQREEDTPPFAICEWVSDHLTSLENRIKAILLKYSEEQLIGRWATSQMGIGPIISAGLLAHIDMDRAQTAGNIWNFAGLNPGIKWLGAEASTKLVRETIGRVSGPLTDEELDLIAIASETHAGHNASRFRSKFIDTKGEPLAFTAPNAISVLSKRPWNGRLKRLCWIIGESFVKVSGYDHAYYGKIYAARKLDEQQRNMNGVFADQAARILTEKKYRDDTKAKACYEKGELPPAHIHARACRWTVKLFLSHWHAVAYRDLHGVTPPMPYAIAYLGHAHYLEPPDWPWAG